MRPPRSRIFSRPRLPTTHRSMSDASWASPLAQLPASRTAAVPLGSTSSASREAIRRTSRCAARPARGLRPGSGGVGRRRNPPRSVMAGPRTHSGENTVPTPERQTVSGSVRSARRERPDGPVSRWRLRDRGQQDPHRRRPGQGPLRLRSLLFAEGRGILRGLPPAQVQLSRQGPAGVRPAPSGIRPLLEGCARRRGPPVHPSGGSRRLRQPRPRRPRGPPPPPRPRDPRVCGGRYADAPGCDRRRRRR